MLQLLKSRMTIVVFLICLLCFFLPDVKAQQVTIFQQVDTNKTLKGGLSIRKTFIPMQTTALHFGLSQEAEVIITWKNNKLEVLYGKETKPSEAVKQFFNWLKEYSEQNYYIIKKEDLDKVLGKK